MSFYFIVQDQALINLGKLAEQQKNQRASKYNYKILKRTLDEKFSWINHPFN